MTNRQWLETLSDEELAVRIKPNNNMATMTKADNWLFELCRNAGVLYSREKAIVLWLRSEFMEDKQ